MACGCLPGTEENGWHEIRSEACLQRERDDFARAMKLAYDWGLTKRRGRPHTGDTHPHNP
jgi:hypothetical protein